MAPESQKLELIQMILMLQDEDVIAKIKAILKNASKKTGSNFPVSSPDAGKKREFGFAKGLITHVSADFDETPAGFEDYIPSK